jgi:hypothetical protein
MNDFLSNYSLISQNHHPFTPLIRRIDVRISYSYSFSPRACTSLANDSRILGSPNCSPDVHSTFKASSLVLVEAA